MSKTTTGLAYILLGLVLWLPATAWLAYAASLLWGWFITPTFGIPVPGLWMIAGLLLVMRLPDITRPSDTDTRDLREKVNDSIATAAIAPLFLIGFGWICHTLTGMH